MNANSFRNPAFNSPALVSNTDHDSLLSASIFYDNSKSLDKENLTITPKCNSFFGQSFFRKKFNAAFDQIKNGYLIVDDSFGRQCFGDINSDLKCHITIKKQDTYKQLALAGSNGSAEAYIEGHWCCDNPSNLVRILLRNRDLLDSMETGLARAAQFLYQAWHQFNRNSKSGSKKNIAAHYDLGNDFFALILDKRMMYSSALYEKNDNLDDASNRKLQRICDELKISEQDTVIEIGSGWGGFACYAAKNTGCKITTITISQEQFSAATEQVYKQNLQHLVTVKLIDYRDIDGQFDKLVSIEMIEAVGHQYVDQYFKKINQLLKPNGQAMLQAIVIDDDRYEQALKEVDYIKRFIFPGSFIPCYSLIQSVAKNNNLYLDDQFDMGSSYAQTLRDWRQQFYKKIQEVEQLGYDDHFQRMWEFYLCYCEGGFEERAISVGQIRFTKSENV